MPNSGIRTILLTGAPESSSLEWTDDVLTTSVLPAFSTDLEHDRQSPRATGTGPVWRRLPLEDEALHTGYTPVGHEWGDHATELAKFDYPFLDSANSSIPGLSLATPGGQVSFIEGKESTEFYDRSLLIHDKLPSSQIVADQDPNDPDSIFLTSNSNCTSFNLESFVETGDTSETDYYPKPASVPIRDLRNLPTINYLRSIMPRRMTVNLIVAVVSIPSPIQLITRYGQRRIDLVEMIASDDTRSGFAINLWLPPFESSQADPAASPLLKVAVSKLRPRDVVLMRNIELNIHDKRVFGQNLRRDLTKVHLLYRDRLDRSDERGAYGRADLDGAGRDDLQLAKIRKVINWVVDFGPVGINRAYGHAWGEGGGLEDLPPDTSED